MTTKRQLRAENIKEKKIKKSTRLIYLFLVVGGVLVILIFFFVALFSVLFPTSDMNAMEKKDKQVVVYFSDAQERFLMLEKRYVYKRDDIASEAKEIVKALIDGSKSKAGLVNTFPSGASVRDVKVDKTGTAVVDFDKNLIKLHNGGSTAEMATIYSLTNSITQNIPAIKKVKIMVDGKELQSIKGHISTQKAFSPDMELVVQDKEKNS
jgi:hypothetical protein